MQHLFWTVNAAEEEELTESLFERGFSAIATEPLENGLVRVSLFIDDVALDSARVELQAITHIPYSVADYSADWKNAWCDPSIPLPSLVIEDALTIYPDDTDIPPARPNETRIVIRPQDTFGYGSHPSSQLALEAMVHQQERFSGASVLDFGTGSGVLAIVAAKFGAESVLAIDNDPSALERAAHNAQINELSSISFAEEIPESPAHYDIVIANIPLTLLEATIESLLRRGRKNSLLILSGYLSTEEPRVLGFAQEWEVIERCEKDGWGALIAQR